MRKFAIDRSIKNFIFIILTFGCFFLTLYAVCLFGFSPSVQKLAIIATDSSLVIVTVAIITGQAKIDVNLPSSDDKTCLPK